MKLIVRILLLFLALLVSLSCVSCINQTDNGPATTLPKPIVTTAASTTAAPKPPPIDPPADSTGVELISIEMRERYGDSTLIKHGDYEVLVDAGDPDDAPQIQEVLREHCADGILEMLIVTHAHEDHLGSIDSASFFTGANITAVETVVDFGCAYTTQIYGRYKAARDRLISAGSTYYPITEIIADETIPDIFYFDDPSVYIEFFDTGYYLTPDKTATSANINDTSVAFCLNYASTKVLLTGDLTKKSEKTLVANIKKINENYFKEEDTVIFKANHHGSQESNEEELLSFIKPDYIFISAAIEKDNRTSAGIKKLQHPYNAAILRMKKYTDQIYWNGINGTTTFYLADDGSVGMETAGRTLTYYVGGILISAEDEKKLTLLLSKWYTR